MSLAMYGASAGMNMLGQYFGNMFTNRARAHESNKAWRRSKKMFHLVNEYNSPEAQMQRFRDAGLNPNLIYGQGNPGNASQVPKYEPPQQSWQFDAPNLAQFQDLELKQAQRDNLRAQTELLDQRKMSEFFNTGIKEILKNFGTIGQRYGSRGIAMGFTQRDQANQSWLSADKRQLNYHAIGKARIHVDNLFKYQGQIMEQQAKKLRFENANLLRKGKNIDVQTYGKQLENQFRSNHINPNDPTNTLQMYKFLADQGLSKSAIAGVMSTVGVGSKIIENVVGYRFRGLRGASKFGHKTPKQPGMTRPKYNSAESWRQFGRRHNFE